MLCAALQASTIAIIALGGRLPQIMLNARRGNSGELSPLTSILNLAGNVVRLFTTAVLTKVATAFCPLTKAAHCDMTPETH